MNTPQALGLGGNGYLSSEASLCPKLARSVITHWEAGRFPESKELKQLIRDRIAPEKNLGHSDR